MFHVMIMGFTSGILNSTSEEVCYREIVDFSALGTSVFGYGMQNAYGQYIGGPEAELPFNIWAIVSILVLTHLMSKMCDWSVGLASRLSGGYVNLSAVPLAGADKLSQAIKGGASDAGKAIGKAAMGGSQKPAERETVPVRSAPTAPK